MVRITPTVQVPVMGPKTSYSVPSSQKSTGVLQLSVVLQSSRASPSTGASVELDRLSKGIQK